MVNWNSTHSIIILNVVLPAISLVFLLVRNYSRFLFLRVAGWDDTLFNLGWLSTAILNIMVYYSTKLSLTIPPPTTKEDAVPFLKILWVVQMSYLLANFFIKSAYLLFSARLASTGIYYKASKSLLIFNCALFVGCLLSGIFICIPVRFFWDRTIEGGKCVDIKAFYISNAFLNSTMDVATLVIPICIIWTSLSMSWAKKMRISALFLLGTLTCVCSIMRIPTLFQSLYISKNTDWNLRESTTWSSLELNVAIITGCIPAIKPLIAALLGHATPMPSRTNPKPVSGAGGGGANSWATGRLGHYQVSVSAADASLHDRHGSIGGRGAKSDSGEHIVLQETFTVTQDERWDSRHSIVSSTRSPPR